jgi:hypothetical protein
MGYCPSFVSHDATTLIFGFVLFYHDRRKLGEDEEARTILLFWRENRFPPPAITPSIGTTYLTS